MKIRPLAGSTLSCEISQNSADVTVTFRNFVCASLQTAKYDAINTRQTRSLASGNNSENIL
jgi:hypothetical protein